MECPFNPYPGMHGTGKGNDAVTSGFEGPWTTKQVKRAR
jgi:catalase (peroxidase I)